MYIIYFIFMRLNCLAYCLCILLCILFVRNLIMIINFCKSHLCCDNNSYENINISIKYIYHDDNIYKLCIHIYCIVCIFLNIYIHFVSLFYVHIYDVAKIKLRYGIK